MTSRQRKFRTVGTVGALYVLLAACTTWQSMVRTMTGPPPPNRGIIANHALHADEGLECLDCHEMTSGSRVSFASHEMCSVCHDIPEESIIAPLEFAEEESCQKCHLRDDFSVLPTRQIITNEILFDHQAHSDAQVSCATCHENPDRYDFEYGALMDTCMECHESTDHTFTSIAQSGRTAEEYRSNTCTVCHREITEDTRPQFRHGERIAHDSHDAWIQLHGSESYVDQAYCMQCHVEEEDCMTCHRIMKPDNHTLAWNRRLHGAHAQWDSQSCAACHEEDSCMQCHEQTQPLSHRSGFLAPRNNHCVQCHVQEENSCMLCHESIEHRTAPRMPHDVGGGFAGNCAECHPNGIPGVAPHLVNASVSCRTCHQ